ncbi:preprotein translocase subunit SecE [Mycoplasmopsis anatis]|uniref:Protein translocase subunit SecE n=1 Tax=Mycoplasmopsis anatis TaxID=171279 RepID=A0A9Q3LA72_9BACT|nr:preprotein translocase subunit SecE [Mycoplasmopsis anatis]MBW0594820.1 preprotein translocase subunit SecE [Mycoplasmopsis anatis]MBW0595645.1 preprotein translocase subunit SecE [Mycoplasmopsis anatis]MBW0596200.1 preprotein translocase subunit SecE [Mycoplasmopsis anatis]MBW0596878.1 preprotein translocase subunit SecE [Mycoplasmopsis anatis]MBW0597634.1 preprotein translocase subunit SecE [Mycoplasmopsis anatis]
MKEQQQKQTKIKKTRNKKYLLRKTIKEIKRVRWPDKSKNISSMTQIIIFSIVFMIFAFAVSIAFTYLWNYFGIGI